MGLLLPFFLGEVGVTLSCLVLFCFVLFCLEGMERVSLQIWAGAENVSEDILSLCQNKPFSPKLTVVEYGVVWSFPLVTAGPLCSPQSYTWSGQAWAGLMGCAWAWAARNSSCQEAAMSCLSRGVCPIWDELDAEYPKPLLAPIQGKSTTRMW